MSNSLEAQGKIHSIGDTAEFGSNGFTKREFVIVLSGDGENADYPNYIAFELVKDKCALMDSYQIGSEIKVHFNLTGRLWQPSGKPEKCFTNLRAWRIEGASAEAGFSPGANYDQGFNQDFDQGQSSSQPLPKHFDDDIPF